MATQLQIPAPCNEKWSEMTPLRNDCRHCSACDRQIVDFTMKTDTELLQYISQNHGKICGRFRTEQLNRPLVTARSVKRGGLTAIAASFAAVLAAQQPTDAGSMGPVVTNQPPVLPKVVLGEPAVTANDETGTIRTISGKILDELGEPMIGAVIVFSDNATKTLSDGEGFFSLKVPLEVLESHPLEMQIKYAGYDNQTVPLPPQILKEDLSLLPNQTQVKDSYPVLMGVMVYDPSFDVDTPSPKPPSPLRRFFQKLF